MRLPFDYTVYPYSKISKMPTRIQHLALIIRNLLTPRIRYAHHFDGIATCHNLGFLLDPQFQSAESRAIQAGGFDYFIPLRLHQAIWCARNALKLDSNASFVEFGTGKGYVMSAVLSYLKSTKSDLSKIHVFLFDTFDSFATDHKGLQSAKFGRNIYYAESFEDVERNFQEFSFVTLVKGNLPQILDLRDWGGISFLHVDLNAPEIEVASVLKLWNQILPGGIVLIDDYAYNSFSYTYQLFNNLADELKVPILTTASGQGIMIKR